MSPEEYISRLEELSDADDAEGLLAFSARYRSMVQPELTLEQRNIAADLAHWAVMVVDLRNAALAKTSVGTSSREYPGG